MQEPPDIKRILAAPSPWWNEECNDIIRSKNLCFREFKQHPSSANLCKYLDACKIASKIFAKNQKIFFKRFCSSLNIDTPLFNVWRYIRVFSNKRQGNSCQTTVSEEAFHETFNKLAPLQPIHPTDLADPSALPFINNNHEINYLLTPFSIMEYRETISSLKSKSAPDPDLISNKIIQKFPIELHSLILETFNLMFNKSVFSKQWNEYFTVFIPKQGKKDALRPISLANNLHKIFERLIYK
ncbi:rna-directed dna polymerase from mobile element jockey-like protein [Lasius niger]|uniref:Rna-directed dna polymerase from mobile element jockey-like protein n=1 Tax=Lasius niger TaxID=67767 RepID=A0A0J7KCW7_LASNI|nr:rna-directed dna polymerase from mobile element jockey-like protein [Lasius niger]